MPPPGMWKGCGRGIFGLSTWEPLRKPNRNPASPARAEPHRLPPGLNIKPGLNGHSHFPPRFEQSASRPYGTDGGPRGHNELMITDGGGGGGDGGGGGGGGDDFDRKNTSPKSFPASTSGAKLLAKYSYKANPESPIGRELDMKQGDQLTLVSDVDAVWWKTENSNGEVGYVPASYVMKWTATPAGLPWLQNQEADQRSDKPAGKAKPYTSAYNRVGGGPAAGANAKQFYCELCDKQLNGPTPFRSHMVSKAHKYELEYRNSCQ